ncbi:hypothetical protein [Tateyamaria sp. Alg231-49]|uniref:hypothetical protein n=1 Tax=Tateyamaria sp. Alg231-49 TaxID=1922219 RepID=UPI000D56054B|nr:hypothetical protein [Tateyamaria sp. Alg231-49]
MRILVVLIVMLLPGLARADDRQVSLYAPPALIESGLVQHIKPRFSLKTQVKVDIVGSVDAADIVLGAEGRPLFSGLDAVWHLDQRRDTKGADRFAEWLVSEIGTRTILSFAPDGTPVFAPPPEETAATVAVEISREAIAGKEVSYVKCSRCHVTERGRGIFGIGSTPSFAVMRGFEDWEARFAAFFVLNPHEAFTQIEGVTEPFPLDRPSPISPIVMTLDDLDAILAYVAIVEPADLGKPLEHQ